MRSSQRDDIIGDAVASIGETGADFRADLRLSPRVALVALAASALGIFIVSGVPNALSDRLYLIGFSALIVTLTMTAWRLTTWRVGVGRWATVVVLVIEIHLAQFWLGGAAALVLSSLPVALTAAMIDVPAAAGVAAGETLLIFVLSRLGVGGEGAVTLAAVVSVWLTWGVTLMIYHPVYQVAHWAWEYFQRAQYLLEEARDRRAELEQAFDDLAHANTQLTRLNLLAQGLRQAAEDARTAKEQFVANVSHELRTPLNMITGFSEMILQAPETYGDHIPPALLADLAVVQRNAEHLAELIDDVLDLSQVEANQMALTKEYVAFPEVVATATLAVQPLFASRHLYLETQVPAEMPPVFCDRTRIREVLLNLLSNAGRFTEQGGVQLRVTVEKREVVVSVADTGRGIAPRDIPKLFQPFQQVDGSIRRRYGGTGLGLSISKRFIELHGGRIWVESESGKGTTFYFSLPISPPSLPTEDFSRWINPEWEFHLRTRPVQLPDVTLRPRFVVLETTGVLQRLLNRYLEDVEVVAVASLEAAWAELEQVPAQALLINSASVNTQLRQLRQAGNVPEHVPIILCSIPVGTNVMAALEVAERLVKPVSREVLLATLESLGVGRGTVLVVDDDPDALQLFGRMLASAGKQSPDGDAVKEPRYRVLLARDGEEALQVLGDYRPDVILLDLVMPNLDGFALLERRAENPEWREIPVVIASARDPFGQPIISHALAVMQGGGISTRQLLLCIQMLSQVLGTPATLAGVGVPELRETGSD